MDTNILNRVQISVEVIEELLEFSSKLKELIDRGLSEEDLENLPYIFDDMLDTNNSIYSDLVSLLRIQRKIIKELSLQNKAPVEVDLTKLD